MKMKMLFASLCVPFIMHAQGTRSGELNGQWSFAMDAIRLGEQQKWFNPDFKTNEFAKVNVPHCFSVDPRYMFYTGNAWYIKKFNAAEVKSGHAFIKFDAAFYRSKVWLNGELLGEHEGGYTPFEFDVTKLLKAENTLAVEVNNEWDTTTIPGVKGGNDHEQFYPWINYGGLTRPVHLITRPDTYISNTKIVAEPDLKKGSATIQVTAFIKNVSSSSQKAIVNVNVLDNGKRCNIRFKPFTVNVDANGNAKADFVAMMTANEIKLWNQDEPNLYTAQITTGTDTSLVTFGIRKLKVAGTQLLLNGEPIKMGGANRPLDYPGFGSIDPVEVLEKDLGMMKSGGMELSRISHYPVSDQLLEWADKHGMLIITEAGNWQMTTRQMADTMMRRKFRSQMKEMIERDWNHPSVVAYSMGNEFPSNTNEGKAWVRDMREFARSLDSSRLITFASMYVQYDFLKKPDDEASMYCDFVSANIYGGHLEKIKRIHSVYPDKPIFISEFGMRADERSEEDRIKHLRKVMEEFRQCDYVVGASVWTFNDYFSRFHGTGPNGYRGWGLVTPDRTPRGMYGVWQEEFAPATIELINKQNGKATLKVSARTQLPCYTLRGYQLKYNQQTILLNTLKPGDSQLINIDMPGGEVSVDLIKPGGFVMVKKVLF